MTPILRFLPAGVFPYRSASSDVRRRVGIAGHKPHLSAASNHVDRGRGDGGQPIRDAGLTEDPTKPAPYRAQDLDTEGHCCGDARRDARRRLYRAELIPRKPPEPVRSGSDREVQRAGDGTERYFHTAGGRFGPIVRLQTATRADRQGGRGDRGTVASTDSVTEDAVGQLDIDGAGGDLDSDALALIGSPLALTTIAGLL